MRDLFVTELGMEPVEDKTPARDLLADEPAPTFQEQIERHLTDTIGETEDEKRLIENLFTEEERAEIAKMPQIGFCEAIKGKGLVRSLPFIGSGLEAGEGIADLQMLEKAKNGDGAAKLYIRDKVREDMIKQMRGTTIGGQIGNILNQAPAFMTEFAVAMATFGAGAAPQAAKAATQQAVKKGVKEFAKKALTVSAKAATATAAMPQLTANAYIDRRFAGAMELTDKGDLLLKDMDESPALTATKAFADSLVEVSSEMAGGAIQSGISKIAAPVSKMMQPAVARMGAHIPVKFKDALFRGIKKVMPDANISKMLSDKVYFNGILGEYGEERLGDVARAVLGLNESDKSTTDQILDGLFPDKEQMLAEIGAFTIMGVGSHSAVRAVNGLMKKGFSRQQAEATVADMSETQKEALAKKVGISDNVRDYPVREVALDEITLSEDVPNFKEGADDRGVVPGEELGGVYDRRGTAPIVIWERLDGRKEVITGRHRLELARRTGEKTIPAQTVKEADGFTKKDALTFDAEQNIRDEKGTTKDYVRYFTTAIYDKGEADRRGLLARVKGKHGWSIGKMGSDLLRSAYLGGKVAERAAVAIAEGAPGNERLQAVGLTKAKTMTAEELKAFMSILSRSGEAKETKAEQGNLFGFDDSYLKEQEQIAKLVSADRKNIKDKIKAVKGALRNPEAAKSMGLSFDVTPEGIQSEVARLEELDGKLENFAVHTELYKHYQDKARGNETGNVESVAENVSEEESGYTPDENQGALFAITPETMARPSALAEPNIQSAAETENAATVFGRPFMEYEADPKDLAAARWTDYLRPLKAFGKNIYRKARLYAGVGGKIETTIKYFTTDLNGKKTGEGLLPIVDDFKAEFGTNQKTAEYDLGGYLIAKRYLEDLEKRDDVYVSDAKIQESLNFAAYLKQKYGENFMRFDHYAERIYDYQQRVSHLLVDSGLMSEKAYAEMLENNPHYIPFYRVLPDDVVKEPAQQNAKSRGILRSKNPLKKIQGSDLDIRNPFASIVTNTAKIVSNAYKNDIKLRVAKMRRAMPSLVKEKLPDRASFDKGLRDLLKAGIKKLGGTYERTNKRLTADGRAFGVYLPIENKIREKFGSDAALAHEFGHMLDYKAGFGKAVLTNDEVREELKELANERLGAVLSEENGRFVRETKQPKKDFADYLYADEELVANLYDAYVNAPELLHSVAPTAEKLVKRYVENSPHEWLKDIHRTLDVGFETMYGELDRAKNIVPYYQNGQKKYIEVHSDLYEALEGVEYWKSPAVIDWLAKYPNALLRWGATQANITFALIRNPLRDTIDASIQSGVGFIPVVDTLRGAYDVLMKTDTYKEWKANGGSFDSFMQLNENSKLNPYRDLFGHASKLRLLNPFFYIEQLGGLFEEGTRVGVYRKGIEKGMSGEEAAFASRDSTIDFAKGGTISKNLNQYLTFFNANIQGLATMCGKFKERPVQMSVRAFAELTVPSVLLSWYFTHGPAPDDDKREYAEIPAWRKNTFWNIKIGGRWVTIPKPFAYGAVFATLPQAVVEGSVEGGDIDWKAQAKNIFDAFNIIGDASSALPLLPRIYLELRYNTNFYTGQDIVPAYLTDVEPAEQFTDRTSEIAKFAGELGLSPAQVEHVITSMGAGLVKDVLNLGDMMKAGTPTREAGEMPVVRGIIGREASGYNSESVQKFMDAFDEVERVHNTLKKLGREDGDRADEYAEKHETDLDRYGAMKSTNKEIRAINKELRKIRIDETLTPDQKRDEMRELRKEMTNMAREALDYDKELTEVKK